MSKKKKVKKWVGWIEKGVTPFCWSRFGGKCHIELRTGGEGIYKHKADKLHLSGFVVPAEEEKIEITVRYL